MEIKAADVMKLRKATNAGMMDCKKALIEAEGNFDEAVDIIRKKGLAIANKRADREAKEGCVLAKVTEDKKNGVILALNCETDFVAKNDGFVALTEKFLDVAVANLPENKEALLELDLEGKKIADYITEQTGVIGEKLEIGYYGKVSAEAVTSYIHPGNKLATVIGFNKEVDEHVERDVAMQAAAMAPVSIDRSSVPEDVVAHELAIGREKAREEGKPEAMLDKIAEGRLNKFFKESTLLEQTFVKDGKISVKQYMQNEDKDLTATAMIRFSLND